MRPTIGRAAIIIALGVATIGYGTFEKRVTVEVDGIPVSVRTFGGTVSSVLDRAGVPVGTEDLVQPSPSTAVDDGAVIEVRTAKWVTLMINGRARKLVVNAVTVQDVLERIGAELVDKVSPSRSTRITPGMAIVIERAKRVEVRADGTKREVMTNARTVREVLDELAIDLGERDKVRPALREETMRGMKIRVMRVRLRTVVRTVNIGYDTILRRDPKMDQGERKVVRQGRAGLKRLWEHVRYVDGREDARRVVKSSTIRPAVDRVIKIGGGPSCACRKGTEVGGASWYSQADGMTAAHKTLPFGTVVQVTDLDTGRSISVRIADRGPYIDGRVIDLSDEAFARLAPLSKGVIRVRIRW